MPNLEGFFSRAFRPFYLVTGAGTALIGLFAFFPSWATSNIAKLPFLLEYTIIIQHWGIMVGLMGLFMMGAAIFPAWRLPIALYSVLEKASWYGSCLPTPGNRSSLVSGFHLRSISR